MKNKAASFKIKARRPQNIEIPSFEVTKTEENASNYKKNMVYFLLRNAKIPLAKSPENQKSNLSLNQKGSKKTDSMRKTPKIYTGQNNPTNQKTNSNIFLKNDLLALSTRVTLSQKTEKVDKKLLDLMMGISKNLIAREKILQNKSSGSYNLFLNKNSEMEMEKNEGKDEFLEKLDDPQRKIKRRIIKLAHNNSIDPNKKLTESERQSKIKQILSRTLSGKIFEIEKIVTRKQSYDTKKKVVFNLPH